jgi:hypothetical protein
LRSFWTVHEPPSSTSNGSSTNISTNCHVTINTFNYLSIQ